MPRTVLAVQHLAFEDLGLLAPLLAERDCTVRYLQAGIEAIDDATLLDPELVVVLGGPIGANDGDRYPFLDDEIGALRSRLAVGKATLGICLGAQLMVRALDAGVAPSGHTEIGYGSLTLTPEAAETPLRHLDEVPVLHWHNDRFEIPAGAARLAGTEKCSNQAYAIGPRVLGLQFHLETPPGDLERWLIGHADAIMAAGLDPRDLRAEAAAVGPALVAAGSKAMGEWLDGALIGK